MSHDPAEAKPDHEQDRKFLLRAVELSRSRMEAGLGGPFGAVLVRDGDIIAEGWNEVTSSLDPTAHAEVTAIRRACQAVGDFSLKGATLYSSCEPCPMCLAATYWARVDRLVYANTRTQAASIGFDDEFLYEEIPRDPASRSLPTRHVPLPEAEHVFDLWAAKADKIAY
jgi:tRNA(Arg) A34 adenosine deaminase TadA